MRQRNDELRAARERTPSPADPTVCASRREVAEAVNEWLFETTGEIYAFDAHHLAKIERGVIRWPARRYREALRAVLGVATDAELGLRCPRRGARTVSDVDRRDFVKVAAGLGAGLLTAGNARPAPVAGTNEVIAAVAGPTVQYRRLEGELRADALAPAVEAHRRLATDIVDTTPSADTYAALSEITGLAAWLAADLGDTATARHRYVEAVILAQRSGRALLLPYMLASLGNFAVETGDARHGLSLIEQATALLDRSAPDTARAWLASLRAVACASLGNLSGTTQALSAADRYVGRSVVVPRWPWVFAFDAPKAAVYRGAALVRLGDCSGAASALRAAQPALRTPKAQATALLDQAHVQAGNGDIGEGARLAVQALDVAQRYGSERITARVRAFRAGLPVDTAEAAGLDDALARLYAVS